MSELLIVTFEDDASAFALNEALADLRREQRLETQDTTVVTRDSAGEVTLHGKVNVPLAQAVGGSVWGLVLGAVFLLPIAGAAVGAATGYLTGRSRDPGVDNDFIERIGKALPRGGSALCLWVRDVDSAALLDRIRAFPVPGQVITSPLDAEGEARLRAALTDAEAAD